MVGVVARAYGARASVRLSRRSARRVEAIERVREALAADPAAPVSLRVLAVHAGLSPFQLCRAFRRQTGLTLTAYRNELRLRQSLERVASGEELTGVALDLGFSSHSHFSSAFRRCFGTTPSVFRRAASEPLVPTSPAAQLAPDAPRRKNVGLPVFDDLRIRACEKCGTRTTTSARTRSRSATASSWRTCL
jgi:AraC-like DNA-binding protein